MSETSPTEGLGSPGPDAPTSDTTVTADAQLPALDDRAVAALGEVGSQWASCMADRGAWDAALPVDPDLRYLEGEPTGSGRFVRIRSATRQDEGDLEATPKGDEPESLVGRAQFAARRVLIGPPLELKLSLPIGAVLVVLMLSVGLGYRQVIRAYPHGGGSYIVASDSLAPTWGLIAGAGLILDYILTVAVSVAAGSPPSPRQSHQSARRRCRLGWW